MVIKKNLISPQYFRKGEISVSVLEIKSPVHFIVKESPDINTSSDAKKFVEVEEVMQKYYHSLEAEFFQLPLKDSFVVVQHKNKYYRAQVRSITNVAERHLIKVYLLDYGQECSVQRQCLYEIHSNFLEHPFQAVDFKLLDVEPISLVVSSPDFSLDFGPVSTWDVSAMAFIEEKQKAMNSAHIKIQGVGDNFLFGSLHLTFNNLEVMCINEELILKKFARQKKDYLNGVTDINAILSKVEQHHDIQQPSIVREETDSISLSSQECFSLPSQKPNLLTVTDSPPKATTLSPNSLNKTNESMSKLQKLKMLRKKSSGGSSSSTPVTPSVVEIDESKMATNDVSIDDTKENGAMNENKLITQENKSLKVTPSKTEISGKSQLQRLKKYHNTKKSSPSPQKAPDSSTPLNNQTLSEISCPDPPSPLVQTSLGSVIEGISPIVGNKSDAQSSESCSLSLKEDTNSLNVAFMNSTQPKDMQKLSELSINEMQNSNSLKENSTKASPPKPTSTKFRNLKNLYKKRNSLSSKSETKSDENLQTNSIPIEPAVEPEVSVKDAVPIRLRESDSDAPLPKFEDGLNEGFSDVDDMGDLLHCVLNPKNNAAIDSSPDSRYVKNMY